MPLLKIHVSKQEISNMAFYWLPESSHRPIKNHVRRSSLTPKLIHNHSCDKHHHIPQPVIVYELIWSCWSSCLYRLKITFYSILRNIIFIHENEYQHVVCKMVAVSPRPQYDTARSRVTKWLIWCDYTTSISNNKLRRTSCRKLSPMIYW